MEGLGDRQWLMKAVWSGLPSGGIGRQGMVSEGEGRKRMVSEMIGSQGAVSERRVDERGER